MRAATATRPPAAVPQLSQALAAANEAARLDAAARTTRCDPRELSADNGHSLDLLRMLDAMRARGYTVSQPERPQTQLVRGMITYLITVRVPCGAKVKLCIYVPQAAV